MLLQARSALRRLHCRTFCVACGACGMWHVTHIYFWHWNFSRSYFFYFIVRFAFLALTEMERTFPENVVPGWLWSLQRRGWGACATQRGEGRSKSVWGEGRAGAQDDVEMMTMLIT